MIRYLPTAKKSLSDAGHTMPSQIHLNKTKKKKKKDFWKYKREWHFLSKSDWYRKGLSGKVTSLLASVVFREDSSALSDTSVVRYASANKKLHREVAGDDQATKFDL